MTSVTQTVSSQRSPPPQGLLWESAEDELLLLQLCVCGGGGGGGLPVTCVLCTPCTLNTLNPHIFGVSPQTLLVVCQPVYSSYMCVLLGGQIIYFIPYSLYSMAPPLPSEKHTIYYSVLTTNSGKITAEIWPDQHTAIYYPDPSWQPASLISTFIKEGQFKILPGQHEVPYFLAPHKAQISPQQPIVGGLNRVRVGKFTLEETSQVASQKSSRQLLTADVANLANLLTSQLQPRVTPQTFWLQSETRGTWEGINNWSDTFFFSKQGLFLMNGKTE